VADLGLHPGGGNDEPARPAGRVRVHVDHPGPVAERHLAALDRLHALGHRQALAGQRGLGDLQRRRLDQAAVRRDDVARLDRDDVARHELLGRELDERAAP
jgi:hypothetical protein